MTCLPKQSFSTFPAKSAGRRLGSPILHNDAADGRHERRWRGRRRSSLELAL